MNVYLFMGTHLPEVRACLESLAGMAAETGPVEIFWPEGLKPPAPGKGSGLVRVYETESVQWVINPDGPENVFIFVDPRESPISQLERLAGDLGKCLIEPVKVVTCVDTRMAENTPGLRAWLEAAIYYSDVVLLGNRKEAGKAFVRNYERNFHRKCYPCLFGLLKGAGIPENPLEILNPDTRRLSQLFDLPERGEDPLPGLIIEASCDLETDEPEIDPYRAPGEETIPVPDAREWIVESA